MLRPKPIQARMFSLTVGEHLKDGAPPLLPPRTTCKKVVEALRSHKPGGGKTGADCALIISPDNNRIVGIVTEADVTKRIAFAAAASAPIESVMTQPVIAVQAEDYLYTAIAAMHKSALRHMPVVDREGTPIGVLKLDDAMEAGTGNTFRRMQWMHPDGDDVQALRKIKDKQADFAAELLAEYVPVPHIQTVISQMNNELHRSVIEIALSEMLTPPPVAFAAIVMGSSGREENFLNPDQDNGLILDDYPDADHDAIDTWFRQFSEKVNEYLAEVGFTLCLGDVMARNPLWRKTRSQWFEQTEMWVIKRMKSAVSFADIFFDFNYIYGERDLVAELRKHVSGLLPENPGFIRMLMDVDNQRVVLPFGWFGRIKPLTHSQSQDYPGHINLKHNCLMPAVQCLRRLSLKYGIEEVSSHKRLQALQKHGFFDESEVTDIADAFDVLTKMLLEHHIDRYRKNEAINNYILYKSLSSRQKSDLKRSMHSVRDMRQKMLEAATGRVL